MTAPRWRYVAVGIASLCILVETGVRRAGLVDFPLYVRGESFGYAPRSHQSGTFIGRNHWVFNDRALGVDEPWRPGGRTDILLIGNSIVMGGNPYDQKDKLAPLLQARLGTSCAIWPVASGGWSTVNEIGFLESNADLVDAAKFFVWEFMPGQMTRATPWGRETLQPTREPLWATGYVVLKALQERFPSPAVWQAPTAAELRDNFRRFDDMLARLARPDRSDTPGIVFLYPDRRQLASARAGLEWVAEREQIERLAAAHRLVLIDVAKEPSWTEAMYRDGVHPTAEGNVVLATLLADAVRRARATKPFCPP